jgi:hypothetical protein
MPLDKSGSKAAFSDNVATEMTIGNKPQKQAVAIAYSVQRKAKGGKKPSIKAQAKAHMDKLRKGLR